MGKYIDRYNLSLEEFYEVCLVSTILDVLPESEVWYDIISVPNQPGWFNIVTCMYKSHKNYSDSFSLYIPDKEELDKYVQDRSVTYLR